MVLRPDFRPTRACYHHVPLRVATSGRRSIIMSCNTCDPGSRLYIHMIYLKKPPCCCDWRILHLAFLHGILLLTGCDSERLEDPCRVVTLRYLGANGKAKYHHRERQACAVGRGASLIPHELSAIVVNSVAIYQFVAFANPTNTPSCVVCPEEQSEQNIWACHAHKRNESKAPSLSW